MPTVIDELVTILGIDVDPQTMSKIQKFEGAIDDVTRTVKWAGAALVAMASSVAYFTKQSAEASFELDKMSRLSGIGSGRMQEMGFAAEMAGGSFNGMMNDLMGLTKSMGSPIPGEFNQTLFMMGVNVHKTNGDLKNAGEVMDDVLEKLRGMSDIRQVQWASRLGLSDDTLMLAKMTTEEYEKMKQKARDFPLLLNEQQLKNSREFVIQLRLTERIVRFIGASLASSFVPVLTKTVDKFAKWIELNKDPIFESLAQIIEGIADGFARFVKFLEKSVEWVKKNIPGIQKFTEGIDLMGATSAITTGLLFALLVPVGLFLGKWLLIGAAIGAAATALSMFMGEAREGDTVFAGLTKGIQDWFDEISEKFPGITDTLKTAGVILKSLASIIKDSLIGSFQIVWEIVKPLARALGELGSLFVSLLDKALAVDMSRNAEKRKSWEDAAKASGERRNDFADVIKGLFEGNTSSLLGPQAPNVGGGSVQNNTKSAHVNNTFNINGGNSYDIADVVSKKYNHMIDLSYPGGLAPVTN